MFHRARIPLKTLALLAWNLLRPDPPSARALGRELGMRQETAWRWCHRIRAAAAGSDRPLTGWLEYSTSIVKVQPPAHHAPPVPAELPYGRHVRYTARRAAKLAFVTDGERREVQIVDAYDVRKEIRRLCCTTWWPGAVRTRLTGRAKVVRDAFEHHVRHVAFGVSGRWLERYAALACQQGLDLDGFFARALRAGVVPFERLRPGDSPVDATYALNLRDVNATRHPFGGGLCTISSPAVREASAG